MAGKDRERKIRKRVKNKTMKKHGFSLKRIPGLWRERLEKKRRR